MRHRTHLHLIQARCWESPHAIETARLIIERKCTNMAHLLNRYLPHRERMGMPQARMLRAAIVSLRTTVASLPTASSRSVLMLREARAARAYWLAVATIASAPNAWRRIHPHARITGTSR